MTGHGFLMTTLLSKNQAQKIARLLIEERLAACVQLLPIESFYCWQGKTVNEVETLLLIKTRTTLFDAAMARIKQLHPYSVPEIVGTGFIAGFPAYLDWIDESTQPPVKTSAPKKPVAQKPKAHPHGDGKISARKSAGMRAGISQPMRVK